MSERAVNEFLDRVSAEPPLRERIDRSLEGAADRGAAAADFARGLGFEFTPEELESALQARYGGELSDEELESVAGGMFPAGTKGGALTVGFPDVCKTPLPGAPVPVPYPNLAQSAEAGGESGSVVKTKKKLPE